MLAVRPVRPGLRHALVLAVAGVLAVGGWAYAGVDRSAAAPRADRAGEVGEVSARPRPGVVVIDAGAALMNYATPKVTIHRGAGLKVANHDSMAHTVTAIGRKPDGKPLFDTVVPAGRTLTVAGTAALAPGRYPFYCRFHPFMHGTLTVTGSGGGGHHASGPRFLQPLAIPRVITSAHPHLVVKRTPVRVLPHGPKTMMWTYGGSYPGPTIRRPAGRDTRVTVTNRLPRAVGSITVHLHGDHHASADDGQPTTHLIRPGRSRTYDYPLTVEGRPTRSTLDFYHDHRMMETARNNWYGMQGMFEVTSPAQSRLGLPSGRYDVPLMVADRTFDARNQLVDPFRHRRPPPDDGIGGQQTLVDGRFAPYLDVATHRYRLRLLNSSDFTSYDFELSDGRPFVQIGNGDGLFAHPVRRHDILLGPAQRADVVVDFGHELGRRVVLRSVPRVSNPLHGTGTPRTDLMQFRVTKRVADTSRVPSRLERPERFRAPTTVSYHWVLGTSGTGASEQWTINGHPFDPHVVDATVPLGAKQTWEISNPTDMTHYVHLHEEQWHTVSRDGHRPPPWERGLEDTWRLDPGESVVVAARFDDYPGVFMVHCHMLEHEDDGMMAQFYVLAPGQDSLPPGLHLAPDVPADAATTTGTTGMTGTTGDAEMPGMAMGTR